MSTLGVTNMSVKHEMAYLAMHNFFVDLQDSKDAKGSPLAKAVSGQILDIIDMFGSKFSIYEGLSLFLLAGDHIPMTEAECHMSPEMEIRFDKTTTMAQNALKESKHV